MKNPSALGILFAVSRLLMCAGHVAARAGLAGPLRRACGERVPAAGPALRAALATLPNAGSAARAVAGGIALRPRSTCPPRRSREDGRGGTRGRAAPGGASGRGAGPEAGTLTAGGWPAFRRDARRAIEAAAAVRSGSPPGQGA